jgi:hypothetical protein
MRIVRRHGDLVNKLRAQPLNGSSGGEIVRVAGNRDAPINRADERGDGVTGLQCVAATPECLRYLESDVTGANTNVLSVSYTKIDVPGIRTIRSQNAKMEIWNKSARWLPWRNFGEPQRNLAIRQGFRRNWKHIFCGWRLMGLTKKFSGPPPSVIA